MAPVTLIRKQTQDIDISLTAEVNPEGHLVLSGQDTGQRVEQLFGDMDYEYWTTVSKLQKPSLIQRLLSHAFSSLPELRSWLDSMKIPCEQGEPETGEEPFSVRVNDRQILVRGKAHTPDADPEIAVLLVGVKHHDRRLLSLLKRLLTRLRLRDIVTEVSLTCAKIPVYRLFREGSPAKAPILEEGMVHSGS